MKRFYVKKLLARAMNSWKKNTVEEVKMEIKYRAVRITEGEINKIKKGYLNLAFII